MVGTELNTLNNYLIQHISIPSGDFIIIFWKSKLNFTKHAIFLCGLYVIKSQLRPKLVAF